MAGMELMLHEEDEQMATLDELFAFIDCCDECGCSSESWSTSGLVPLNSPTNKTIQAAHGSPTTVDKAMPSSETHKRKHRRKRTGWSSSTGLQRRKRAELLFLRQHAKDLEAYAEDLKKRVQPVAANAKARCDWQQVAAAEFLERRKSEEANRALRRIMDNQLQLSAALQLFADDSALK
jgi:hypothetical protein